MNYKIEQIIVFSLVLSAIGFIVFIDADAKNQKDSDSNPNIKIVHLEDGSCEFNPEAGDQVPFGWCPSLLLQEVDGISYHPHVFVIPDNNVNENSVITLTVILPYENIDFDQTNCLLMHQQITVSEGSGFFISCTPPNPTPNYNGFPAGTMLNYVITNP